LREIFKNQIKIGLLGGRMGEIITLDKLSTKTIDEWRAWLLRTKYVLSLSRAEKEYYDADGLYEMLDNPFETDTLYFVEKMISFLRKLKYIQLPNVDVGLKKPIPEPPESLIDYIKSIVPEFEY
jgi:hypothetical protein